MLPLAPIARPLGSAIYSIAAALLAYEIYDTFVFGRSFSFSRRLAQYNSSSFRCRRNVVAATDTTVAIATTTINNNTTRVTLAIHCCRPPARADVIKDTACVPPRSPVSPLWLLFDLS